jgi:hypothetical protein
MNSSLRRVSRSAAARCRPRPGSSCPASACARHGSPAVWMNADQPRPSLILRPRLAHQATVPVRRGAHHQVPQFVCGYATEQHRDICSCRGRQPRDAVNVHGRQDAARSANDRGVTERGRRILARGSLAHDQREFGWPWGTSQVGDEFRPVHSCQRTSTTPRPSTVSASARARFSSADGRPAV